MASKRKLWPPEPFVIEGYVRDPVVNAVGTLQINENGRLFHIHGVSPIVVKGGLYLSNTQIRELPAGLTVGGGLYLYDTPIRELPADLKVGGEIHGFKGREK